MLPGWYNSGTHNVTIFFSYPTKDLMSYTRTFLAISPLESEYNQSPDGHMKWIENVLYLYGT